LSKKLSFKGNKISLKKMLKESKTSKSEKQNKKIDSSLKSKEKKSNCLENCSSPEKFKEKILT